MDPEKQALRPRNPPPIVDLSSNVEKLCEAVSEGDLSQVQSLLSSPHAHQFINLTNQKGQTPLHVGASQGRVLIVLELLKRTFIHVDIQLEGTGTTALHVASFRGHTEIIALLLAKGASHTTKNKLGTTPLQEAKGKAAEVFSIFFSGGAEALSQIFPKVLLLKETISRPGTTIILSKSGSSKTLDEAKRPVSPTKRPILKRNLVEDSDEQPEEWCPATSPSRGSGYLSASSSEESGRGILSKQRTGEADLSRSSSNRSQEVRASLSLADSRRGLPSSQKSEARPLSPRPLDKAPNFAGSQRSLTDSSRKPNKQDLMEIAGSSKKGLQASLTDPEVSTKRKLFNELEEQRTPSVPPIQTRDSEQGDSSCLRPLGSLFQSPKPERDKSPPKSPKSKRKDKNNHPIHNQDRWTIWDETPDPLASPKANVDEQSQSPEIQKRPNRPSVLPPIESRLFDRIGESPPVRPAKPPVQYGLLLSSIQDLDNKPDSFVNRVISDVDQQLVREMQSSQPGLYLEFIFTICSKKTMSRMNVQAKAALVAALCPLRFTMASRKQLQRIVDIILDTQGDTLTELKDTIDYNGGYDNLHRIVFDYIEKKERKLILSHIFTQANRPKTTQKQTQVRKPIKVLSDIDDTWISSGGGFPAGVDDVFPKKVPYPGVFAFYRELDLNTNSDIKPPVNCERSNLTFLSAKPHTPGGVTEDQSYKQFKQFKQFHTNPVLLAGDLGSFGIVFGAFDPIVEKKVQNFIEYISLYPDHSFVWIGDNGQGDYKVGIQMLEMYNCVTSVFIHRVVPIEETFGFKKGNENQPNVYFFDTYIGAAVEAFNQGLISEEGLVRIANAAKEDFAFIKSTKSDTLGMKRGKSKIMKEGTIRRQKLKESQNTFVVNHCSSLYESSQLCIQQLQELESELELADAEPFYEKFNPEENEADEGADGLSPRPRKFNRLTKELNAGYDCGVFLQGRRWEVDIREGLNIGASPPVPTNQPQSPVQSNQRESYQSSQGDKSPSTKEKSNPPSPRGVDTNERRKLGVLGKEKTKKPEDITSSEGTETESKRKLQKEKTKIDFQFEVAKSELNKDIGRANLYLTTPIPLIE